MKSRVRGRFRKLFITMIAIFMISPLVTTKVSFAQNNNTENKKVYLYDYSFYGNEKLDKIIEKVNKGFSVAIFGEDLSKVELYPVLNELKVPMTLTLEENQQIIEKYASMFEKDDQTKLSEIEKVEMEDIKNITPLIILHPNKDKVFVDFHEVTVKDFQKVNKGQLNKFIRDYIKEDNVSSMLNNYGNAAENKIDAMVTASASAGFMTSIRKTQTFYGDFYFAGYTHYSQKAGKHITDYLIYNNGDTDADYDYLTVKAVAEIHTFPYLNPSGPPYVTEAYESKFDNYYSSDILLDYEPNTSGLNLSNSSSYNFTVGYPLTVSLGYNWSGKSSTTMKGIGNKTNQLYYNYFYNGGTSGLSTSYFTVEYSAMYKSKGTLLTLYYQNLFGVNLRGSASSYDWYGNTWYTLYYNY